MRELCDAFNFAVGEDKLDTDAIVNAANADLQAGGGVCGAIFREAGMQKLQAACDAIGHCSTGSAVITPGFDLKAKYIIHAVGPIWRGGNEGEPQQLYGAYHKALELAVENGCQSIGFSLISAGIYGYPKEQAWDIAIRACADYLKDPCDPDLKVVFAVLDDEIMEIGKKTLTAVAREYRRFAIDNGGLMMLLRIFAMQKGAPVFTDETLAYENGRALRLNSVTAQEEFRIRLAPETLSAVRGDR